MITASPRRPGGPAPIANFWVRSLVITALVAMASVTNPELSLAQENIGQQLRENEDRLAELRNQRQNLETVANRLRGRVHEITAELENIEQRKNATGRMVNEIDRQINVMGLALDTITLDLILAQDALEEKKAVLDRRLADIYKRGSLWAFQVLLAAESFGDLINRYKYLYLVGRQDKALTADLESLRDRIAARRNELVSVNAAMQRRRSDRGAELSEFRRLQSRRERTLANTQRTQRETEQQIETIDQNERQLQTELARLERARNAAEADGSVPTVATITADDIGSLPWPVNGPLVHGFGRVRMPNNTVIDQRGIGIRVAEGTPVKAVAGGRIEIAMPVGTYGPSVWIGHGGGFRTLYLFLSRIDVREGQFVAAGEQVGLSGGSLSAWGPHVEFQIRGEGTIPLDPANWLRPQR